MDNITKKDANGRYYIVEEIICIGTEQIYPIKTWMTGNENRGYGEPIDRLGKIEDLLKSYNVKDLAELDKLLEMATTYEELSKQLGCSLEVLSTVKEHGFYDEYSRYIPPYRIARIDIFKKEIVYYDEDINGFSIKLSDYQKQFWLRKDRSE